MTTGHSATITTAVYSTKWMKTKSKQPKWVNVRLVIGWKEVPCGINNFRSEWV